MAELWPEDYQSKEQLPMVEYFLLGYCQQMAGFSKPIYVGNYYTAVLLVERNQILFNTIGGGPQNLHISNSNKRADLNTK